MLFFVRILSEDYRFYFYRGNETLSSINILDSVVCICLPEIILRLKDVLTANCKSKARVQNYPYIKSFFCESLTKVNKKIRRNALQFRSNDSIIQ